MATRSLVPDEKLIEAARRLKRGVAPFSAWLGTQLLARLRAVGDFDALKPVLLGSWARGELVPKSDVDLLFTGDEARATEFIALALKDGLTLRARTPLDPGDWAKGVEAFDLLALADAVTPDGETVARAPRARERARILTAVRRERDQRRRRQDAVTNYLEPNLKYGAGGLRDVEQALALARLFPKNFVGADRYPFQVLEQIKAELLTLRAHLHLAGGGEVLSAADQLEMPTDLMRGLQSQLERANFYADWVVARCGRAPAKVKPARTAGQVIARLKSAPSLELQCEVRRRGRPLFKSLNAKSRGALLRRALNDGDDDFLVALHRTRVLEQFVPELKAIRGLVQHDHYHRFTADAHLTQALRETRRAQVQPRVLGPLAGVARGLNAREWLTLKLTALFHDLAKGRGGDHSIAGAELAAIRLRQWGYPAALRADVVFLVRHHLVISTAAFRQNPRARATWNQLFKRGVEGRRLDLLTIFTAIDIRATNPEAWTPWKARLLADLRGHMISPDARGLRTLLRGRPELEREVLLLDRALLEALTPTLLAEDLAAARATNHNLPVRVVRARGRTWVRFHERVDKPGLFYDFVGQLFGFGLNVQMCFVHTSDHLGAYDWFAVKGDRSVAQVKRWLTLPRPALEPPPVRFDSVELTMRDASEWTFACRGLDQRGLLLNAARALDEVGLGLRWARVHTWGRQVEDVFGVAPHGELQHALARLKARLTRAVATNV